MKPIIAAIRFLTILPLPGAYGSGEKDLASSVPFFPVVGLLAGAAALGVSWLLLRAFPPVPAALLLVAFLAAVSGGLHLDGLADTADAFLSSRRRERMLEIMKDSHMGVMACLALFFVLGLKVALFASLPPKLWLRAAFLAPVAGRCALVISMALLPYVRPKGGLGAAFYRNRPRLAAWLAAAVLFAAAAWAAGLAGLIAAAGAIAIVFIFCAWSWRKIGGATGDTLGASCELAELAPPLALVEWAFLGLP